MNKKSQLQFIHRCAVLLESGISLSEVLEIIIRLEKHKNRLSALHSIKENVSKGLFLSKSISLSVKNFEPTLLSMIAFGENAGILSSSMRQALEVLEKGNRVKKKLIGALIYPAFIALATIGMTLFLVMYIFPKIIPLFSSLNIKLPLLTKAVLLLYEFLVKFGVWLCIFGVTCTVVFVLFYKKKVYVRYRVQLICMKIPFIGQLLQKYYASNYCRSMGTLLECGQNLTVVIKQTSVSAIDAYKVVWDALYGQTTKGVALSVSLSAFRSIVPPLVPDMISIGEKTGSLSKMLHHISSIYEEELDEFCKQLGTSIEPVLMIGMGLIVGSVALSIILPIYEITNHLTR